MLRNDNNKLDLDALTTMKYEPKQAKGRKCRTLAEAEMDYKKEACFHAKSQVEQLHDLERKSACKVNECMPVKKCRAKVGLHDGNGNFLFEQQISIGQNSRGNVSQALPVYQQRSIIDLDKYFNQLQADQAPIKSIVIAEAEANLQLYRNPTNFDGTGTGYTCFCKPKPKPCPTKNPCKKPDPFNADIGIGSDAMQVKSDLGEAIRASSVTVAEYELANKEKMLKFYQSGGGGGGAGRPEAVTALERALEGYSSLGGLTGRESPDSVTDTTPRDTPQSSVFSSVRDSPPRLEEIPVAREARPRMRNVEIAQAEAEERERYGGAMTSQERGNFRRAMARDVPERMALPVALRRGYDARQRGL